MQITWTIDTTDFLTSDKYITTAHWRATAQDGDFTASVYGTCGFGEGAPTIPYADVTQAEVLDWCWANGVDKDEIEANLATQIEALKNPTQESGVPW
jgi:hypothetical protein